MEGIKIDWQAVAADPINMYEVYKKRYAEWREAKIIETIGKIVEEHPEAKECYYCEWVEDYTMRLEFLGCVDGVFQLPKGVREATRVDLVAFKEMRKLGVI